MLDGIRNIFFKVGILEYVIQNLVRCHHYSVSRS